MQWNKVLAVSTMVIASLSVACGQKPELTAEQKWDKFCHSYYQASYNIMADRQQGVSKEKALEHMHGTPEGKEKQMLLALIEEAHQTPKSDQRLEQVELQEKFQAGRKEACMNTPH